MEHLPKGRGRQVGLEGRPSPAWALGFFYVCALSVNTIKDIAMTRRYFLEKTALGAAGLWLGSIGARVIPSWRGAQKPLCLHAGARVALIAPASPVSDEKLEQALSNLSALGYEVREGAALRRRYGYLAGGDAERLNDLHRAFADPEVDAIWCIRGGYGATRLLPKIDFRLIAQHPKPLIGYSDITALHVAIGQRTGLVTFHGPGASAELPSDTLEHLRAVLVEPRIPYVLKANASNPPPATICPGKAVGTLIGGNLCLLAAMVGTPFQPSFRGKIVFIEDVGERPYRIDRLLTQLLQATDLRRAAGIALGTFIDCTPEDPVFSLSLLETLRLCLGDLQIPVVYGLPFGHMPNQATLPCGIRAELDADAQTLTLLELGCQS